ncbi:glucose-1-phosphate cytidylyltransferase [Enterovirga sp.]
MAGQGGFGPASRACAEARAVGKVTRAVILAGGLGTRLSEETELRPKPMVEIGGRPILWHIMKIFSAQGINDFVICLGYKGYLVKEYFTNYGLHLSDVTFDFKNDTTVVHRRDVEPWKITLVDTGAETMTGGRLRRVRDYLGDEPFCMTYGDGLADIDLRALVAFHLAHGAEATVTAVQPAGRFGALKMGGDLVDGFQEKPAGDGSWINGGFFVLAPRVLDRIGSDMTLWEREPLESLALDGQLRAFRHRGFWQAMDTLRDKRRLEELWESGRAPWKLW